jgi:hypothetical protein
MHDLTTLPLPQYYRRQFGEREGETTKGTQQGRASIVADAPQQYLIQVRRWPKYPANTIQHKRSWRIGEIFDFDICTIEEENG